MNMEDSTTKEPPVNLAPSARRKGVATRAWLVVSKSGESQVEEVNKYFVRRRTGIPARDLRILDPALSYPSTILGRERAIVVNLEHIKAIITATEMLILNPKDPSIAPFVRSLEQRLSIIDTTSNINGIEGNEQEMEDSLSQVTSNTRPEFSINKPNVLSPKALPFEFVVLENCLEFVCRCFEDETGTLEQEAYPALDELSVSVSTLNLQRVRVIKSRLVALSGRVQKVRDELEHLLDDDMDMAEMYLTDKLISQEIPEVGDLDLDDETVVLDDDIDRAVNSWSARSGSAIFSGQKPKIEELEMLLEAYFVQLDGASNKLSTMREYVDDTEDYLNIILDDKQNQLLRMGVVISIGLVLLNMGIVTAGVLGMNIHPVDVFDYGTNTQFWAATVGMVAATLFLFLVIICSIKKKGLLG